jgi:hypothetical protein
MREYYFDIETTEIVRNRNGTLNFDSMKIKTIQFQEIDSGQELTVLVPWEMTERGMLNRIAPLFLCNPFTAILIGKNIDCFDIPLLKKRLEFYDELFEIGDRITIDLSSICKIITIQKTGGLAGWGKVFPDRNTITNKEISRLIENDEREKVMEYITLEHEGFLKAYKKIKSELPKITFECP